MSVCPPYTPDEVVINYTQGSVGAPGDFKLVIDHPEHPILTVVANTYVVVGHEYFEASYFGSVEIAIYRICEFGKDDQIISISPALDPGGIDPAQTIPIGDIDFDDDIDDDYSDDDFTSIIDVCESFSAIQWVSYIDNNSETPVQVSLGCVCNVVYSGLALYCSDVDDSDLACEQLGENQEVYIDDSSLFNQYYMEGDWENVNKDINEYYIDVEYGDVDPSVDSPLSYWHTNFAYADAFADIESECDVKGGKSGESALDISTELSSSVFPNPSNSDFKLSLQTENPGTYTVNISDIAGHIVQTIAVDVVGTSIINIPMSNEASGMYYYTIYNDTDRLDQGKLIKL